MQSRLSIISIICVLLVGGINHSWAQSSEKWVYRLGSQVTSPDEFGYFKFNNLSAADQFGSGGPGTSPDFLSDDPLRVTGYLKRADGSVEYAYSEPFRIRGGQTVTVNVGDFTVTDIPISLAESLTITAPKKTLTALGQSTRLTVTSNQLGGGTLDVTLADQWTTYRSSNLNIVGVGADGLCTATGAGTAFVTATNGGVSGVFQIDISLGDPLTTVTGVALLPDGTPAKGATITVRTATGEFASTSITDAQGQFSVTCVPTLGGLLFISGRFVIDGAVFAKTVPGVQPIDGATQLGSSIALAPVAPGEDLRFSFHNGTALKTDGSLWVWGSNGGGPSFNSDGGVLGDGTDIDRLSPVRLGSANDWRSVYGYRYAIKSDGTLWAWGSNQNGQVGNGETSRWPVSRPTKIGESSEWARVVGGAGHAFGLRLDGSLWAWGRNDFGQLGDATRITPRTLPGRVGIANDWADISSSGSHTFAIKVDGSLWAWGDAQQSILLGEEGERQLFPPTRIGDANDWMMVATGGAHAAALKTDGSLWSWGRSRYLGDGTTSLRKVPTRVGDSSDWSQVSCGAGHTMAIKTNGSLWGWGSNNSGQIGDGTIRQDRILPIKIGISNDWLAVRAIDTLTIALRADGSLRAWGRGALGNGTKYISRGGIVPSPIQVGSSSDWVSVRVAGERNLALKGDGSLWTWGASAFFSGNNFLGDGSGDPQSEPVQIGIDNEWRTIAVGQYSSAALTVSGHLWAWGQILPALLEGDRWRSSPVPLQIEHEGRGWKAVATSNGAYFVQSEDGMLFTWGRNSFGQLGVGNLEDQYFPLSINSDTDWASFDTSANSELTLAVKDDGTLWGWGPAFFHTSGAMRPTKIGAHSDWQKVDADLRYGIKVDGSLWSLDNVPESPPLLVDNSNAWETITYGVKESVSPVSGEPIFVNGVLALRRDGSLWHFRSRNFANLEPVAEESRWAAVAGSDAATKEHAIALRSDGTLWAWGSNHSGQLGFARAKVHGGNDWGFFQP